MDVKTAFLNGFLKEGLYMMQPQVQGVDYDDPFMDWCKHLGVGIYALIV